MVTVTRDPHYQHMVHMLAGKTVSHHLNTMTTDTAIPGRIDVMIMIMKLAATGVSIIMEDRLATIIIRSDQNIVPVIRTNSSHWSKILTIQISHNSR